MLPLRAQEAYGPWRSCIGRDALKFSGHDPNADVGWTEMKSWKSVESVLCARSPISAGAGGL